jgi:hypothetical protein
VPKDQDPRETYIARSPKGGITQIDVAPEIADDLRYFRRRHEEGSSISIRGLLEYFEKERGLRTKRYRLHSIAKMCGVEPWWGV